METNQSTPDQAPAEKTTGKCTGNCDIRADMFMSICLTCGWDDWGGDTTEIQTTNQ